MKLRLALGLLALVALAGWIRAGTDVLVVTDAGVHLTVPGDPYYHLRRIAWSVDHFPRVLEFDTYLNFPDGGRVVWPPAFDWTIAGVARAWVGGHDSAGAARIAARAPAVFGVLAVLAVFALARRRFSPGAGWLAGGLLAVLPNHVLHSQVGQLDHHVAVSLVAVGLLAAAMALVSSPRTRAWRGAAVGLAFGASLWLWPGMLIHVALLEAMLVVWVAAAAARDEACARARALAALNLGAFAMVARSALAAPWPEFGAWSPWVLSRFQPAFFLAAAATLAATAFVWRRLGATRPRRWALAAGLGAVGLAAAFAVIPGLADSLAVAAGWFSKAESFQENVSELRPFDVALAVSRYTWLVLAFPLAWAGLAVASLRGGAPRLAERALLLGMAAAFLALAALQRRFGNTFSVLYVLVWAGFAAEAAAFVRARPAWRWPAVAGAALLALATLASVAGFLGPRRATLARAHADPAIARRGPLAVEHRLFDAAGRWLRDASPPTRGWDDPSLVPEYGVLTRWDAGHLVRWRARRPLVQDNFGVYGGRKNFERAERYYAAEDEGEALALLSAMEVRYVMADLHGSGRSGAYGPRTMTARLARDFGSATGGVPALEHHRLLWHQRSGAGLELAVEPPGSALGVWEIVAGARVEGRAAPGADVEATLALRTASGRPHRQRTTTTADADGAWTLVLPYPTDEAWSSAVRAEGEWQLRSGGRSATLAVPEAAVRSGATLAGPDLGG
ncbi:MAG TPA: STT3 domain-containing protein [Myxococcota bacterium]|nr:STT3 domain-containing protein [Myxococcota bacterium]